MLVIISTLVLLTVVQGVVVFDPVYNPANAHYYQLLNSQPQSYAQANASASMLNLNGNQGYIVTVTSLEEAQFLGNKTLQVPWVAQTSNVYATYWGNLLRRGNLWSWYALDRASSVFYDSSANTCASSTYCNWQTPPVNESCASIYLNTPRAFINSWKPMNCTSDMADAVVVEYDASVNCQPGYMLDSASNFCVDFNECSVGTICPKGYGCTNRVGTYDCEDVNECLLSTKLCNPGFKCSNTIGSYECIATSFFIQSQLNDLYVEAAGLTAGSNLIMQPKRTTDTSRQLWRMTSTGLIVNEATGLYLTISGYLVQRGKDVVLDVLRSGSQASAQLWGFSSDDGYITTQWGPVTVDINRNDASAGAKLIVWDLKRTEAYNQKFRFINN